jgi:hypothetical protein
MKKEDFTEVNLLQRAEQSVIKSNPTNESKLSKSPFETKEDLMAFLFDDTKTAEDLQQMYIDKAKEKKK